MNSDEMYNKERAHLNKQERDVLNCLLEEPFINQRILAESCGHSLGVVNRSLRNLIKSGYISEDIMVTTKAKKEIDGKSPKRAIILAAGFGMRMVPINMETPKALLEINGERLIERQIKQLHEVGIMDIYIVVGFMKEKFEYLIDAYGVELIVNVNYARKNNLHSLSLAVKYLENSYIVPCDIWCDQNPFHRHELYSWYMVGDLVDEESDVRVNRKMELVRISEKIGGNTMIGISYITDEDAPKLRQNILELCQDKKYDGYFWEEALYQKERMMITARIVHACDVIEINTYEQLREADRTSEQLKSEAIAIIAQSLNVTIDDVTDISVLKKGMTNRSFLFSCEGKKYIMRIPGEGTKQLIDREQEACVYDTIAGKGICDKPVYIDSKNGYKITKYLEKNRTCNPTDEKDLQKCMEHLKKFHQMKLKVEHEFNIWKQIDFYESLWEGEASVYADYMETKTNVLSLKQYIDSNVTEKVLTHIDAVPDNFLFYDSGDGEKVQLMDWEYAGMQDPHMDIAMFCIYSLYNRQQIDRLISIYFEGKCPRNIQIKIYCYIAACGLLWSNWCEYKSRLGVEFGEYSLRQYRYAKEYYRIAQEEMMKLERSENA